MLTSNKLGLKVQAYVHLKNGILHVAREAEEVK